MKKTILTLIAVVSIAGACIAQEVRYPAPRQEALVVSYVKVEANLIVRISKDKNGKIVHAQAITKAQLDTIVANKNNLISDVTSALTAMGE